MAKLSYDIYVICQLLSDVKFILIMFQKGRFKMSLMEKEVNELEAMTAKEVVEYLAGATHSILDPQVANVFVRKLGIEKIPLVQKITNPDGHFKGAHHPSGRLLEPDEYITGVSVMSLVPWMCNQLGIPTETIFLGRGSVVRELCGRLNEHLAE